jgi:hypothetical protein
VVAGRVKDAERRACSGLILDAARSSADIFESGGFFFTREAWRGLCPPDVAAKWKKLCTDRDRRSAKEAPRTSERAGGRENEVAFRHADEGVPGDGWAQLGTCSLARPGWT